MKRTYTHGEVINMTAKACGLGIGVDELIKLDQEVDLGSEEDLLTRKQRNTVRIELTDAQYAYLKYYAQCVGYKNSGQVLEAFVADLTGYHCRGMYEKKAAQDWLFERFMIEVDFKEYYSKNFRQYFGMIDFNSESDLKEMSETKILLEEMLYDEWSEFYDEMVGEYMELVEVDRNEFEDQDFRAFLEKLLEEVNEQINRLNALGATN